MTYRELRPWNVKPGDKIETGAFAFESPTGRMWRTVRMVEPSRNFMSGERCWTIYEEPRNDYSDGRIGTYYRDERVKVDR